MKRILLQRVETWREEVIHMQRRIDRALRTIEDTDILLLMADLLPEKSLDHPDVEGRPTSRRLEKAVRLFLLQTGKSYRVSQLVDTIATTYGIETDSRELRRMVLALPDQFTLNERGWVGLVYPSREGDLSS